MNRFKQYIERSGVWLRRIRQRRGYGIHSPFAFHLVTKVLFDRTSYSQYRHIDYSQHTNIHSRRLIRLYFRLACEFQPHHVVILSPHECPSIESAICQGTSANISFTYITNSTALPTQKIDFIFIPQLTQDNLRLFHSLATNTSPQSVAVIENIHQSKTAIQQWQQTIQSPLIRVTFDLFWVGIICFEKRLNKQDYIINF